MPTSQLNLEAMSIWFTLYQIEVSLWHDVNHNDGKSAHEFYTEDGVFSVGEHEHLGRKNIQEFYQWRSKRGQRTSRHLVHNFKVDVAPEGQKAFAFGVVCLYAEDGLPILSSKPATMIADLHCEFVHCDDGFWRFAKHHLEPIFRGEGRLTAEPKA